mmetsp:Transcript_17224/g.41340  ORF Transcript_17224/g.41340 Transcript_17224/m.41340 type:complete len:165 (-) Transcript_17224:594-1088(-)
MVLPSLLLSLGLTAAVVQASFQLKDATDYEVNRKLLERNYPAFETFHGSMHAGLMPAALINDDDDDASGDDDDDDYDRDCYDDCCGARQSPERTRGKVRSNDGCLPWWLFVFDAIAPPDACRPARALSAEGCRPESPPPPLPRARRRRRSHRRPGRWRAPPIPP